MATTEATGALTPRPWQDVLQDPIGYSSVRGLPLSGGTALARGSSSQLAIRALSAQGNWSERVLINFDAPYVGVPVTRPFEAVLGVLERGASCVVEQRGRGLDLVSFTYSPGSLSSQPAKHAEQLVHLPFLRPFDGFDHLTALPASDCPGRALGVGVFGSSAGPVPRSLQLLTLDSSDWFDARTIVEGFDVITFALVADAEGTFFLGVLGRRDQGTTFSVWRMAACDTFEVVDSLIVDFTRRSPEAPSFGERSVVPLTDGVTMRGYAHAEPGAVAFVIYDGYALQRFSRSAPDLGLRYEKMTVHEDRGDLAF